jgi:hypothetical protein
VPLHPPGTMGRPNGAVARSAKPLKSGAEMRTLPLDRIVGRQTCRSGSAHQKNFRGMTKSLESTATTVVAPPRVGARLLSVGTATPPRRYTQEDVLEWAQEPSAKIRSLFRNSHIASRSLYLSERPPGAPPREETSQELIDKHLAGSSK